MGKKFITEIIKEDYNNWKIGDLVLIKAGTGAGKTYFIKNILNKYCARKGKNILFLTNRDALKEQVKKDIGEFSNITVMNYQAIETFILKDRLDLSNFHYVVMDEAHYFFVDSSFNRKTDLFFAKMLENKTICKILMTATPRLLTWYFEKKEINVSFKYELLPDYSYINKVIAFNTYETIDSIIEDIPEDEQILLFSTAKRSLEIAQKYKGAFICSKYNKDKLYDKYVKGTDNEEELKSIIENGCFNNHLLCVTTALDNGVNIKENTPVKHIIIDIFDRDEFVQCLGRKRVAEGEKVNLYFYSWNDNKRLNGFRTRVANTLERANYLLEHGEIEYTKAKFKTDIIDTRIIDDTIAEGQIHKVVNSCMYLKYDIDMLTYNAILGKKHNVTFKSIIAIALQMKSEDIIDMEVTTTILSLEVALESLVGERLFKEKRKELIEFIGIKDARGRLQKSIGQLNEYFKENKIQFDLRTDTDWNRKLDNETKNPDYGKVYWIVYKLVA